MKTIKTIPYFLVSFFKFYFYFKWKSTNNKFKKDNKETWPYSSKDWQKRQQKETPMNHVTNNYFSEIKMIWYHAWILANIKYTSDEKEYWQTALETEKREKGDCEDQAILLMYKLRKSGFGDNELGILAVPGHVFAIVDNDNDFWCLNNVLWSCPKRASYYINKKNYQIQGAFNFFDSWNYER